MRIIAIHGIDDLAGDMRRIATKAPVDLTRVVREGARVGADVARQNARRTAGRHGKHYPKSITSEMRTSLFGGTYSAEYGPDASRPQGRMSFEFGSRNQPPHLDLAKSADLIGPAFAQEVGRTVEGWFW